MKVFAVFSIIFFLLQLQAFAQLVPENNVERQPNDVRELTENQRLNPSMAEEYSTEVLLSPERYYTGGILGSIFGLGIGHAIEGRWTDKGYIFTFGETLGALLLSPVIYNLTSTKTEREKCVDFCTLPAFALVYGGLRVWEIVDIWTGASPETKRKNRLQTLFLPDPNSPRILISYQF